MSVVIKLRFDSDLKTKTSLQLAGASYIFWQGEFSCTSLGKEASEKKIAIRLTEEQYEEVERFCGELSRSEFLHLLLLNYLERPEFSEKLRRIQLECFKKCRAYKKLYGELGKIGSNVNQIARALNAKRVPAKEKKLLTDLAVETVELIQDLKQKLAEERIGSPQENSQ